MTPSRQPIAVRRFTLVAIIVPLVLTSASVAVQLAVLSDVPSTIAIHWNAAGVPDGFGPAWAQPVMTVAVGLGIPLLIALSSLTGLRRGDRGPTYRLMGAIAASVSALSSVLFAWTLVVQRGLTDPADAPSVLPGLGVAFAAAAVVGVGAWFIQPDEPAHNVTSVPAPRLQLAPGEQAAWFGTAALGRPAAVILGVACGAVVATALLVWFSGAPATVALLLGGVALLLVALAATTTVFHVRVDAAGLTVVAPVGFPRFRVPLSEVREVTVAEVSPMGEFGGYGIRSAVGAFGVVMRRGPAISVVRTSGKRFVVTVDDAERGAALLQALVDRERTVGGA
jgi:hypothetical protein